MLDFLSKLFGSETPSLLGETSVGSVPNASEMALSGAGQMAQLTGQGANGMLDILSQTQATVPGAGSGFSDLLAKNQMQMLMDIVKLKQGDPSSIFKWTNM